jgi:predicted RNase H-like HicB family nuclease
MHLRVEIEPEDDGRWIAEIPDMPGVMVYGASRDEALSRVQALALRVLADRLEHGEEVPSLTNVFSVVPA